MGEVPPGDNKPSANEDSIQVVARFRPLNDSEERAKSRFVVSFPTNKGQDDQFVSIGVSFLFMVIIAKM